MLPVPRPVPRPVPPRDTRATYKMQNVSHNWHDVRDSFSYILTDFWFKCASARMALAVSEQGGGTAAYS